MASETQKRSRLITFFFIGAILFNYPVLSLFSDEKKEIFGIPLLYAYVFTIWALLIGLTFITVMIHRKQDSHHSDKVL
jgi:TRAP-type C4-dicarboxylate transport system permease small subunit